MFKATSIVKNASSAMPSDLKYENRWRVLNVFRDGSEYTANEVAAITGISRQTTMKAIHFFCSTGLLSSLGKGDSTIIGGKKPEYFAFCRKSYLVCITMWPETINLTLFDLVRHKLDYEEHPVEKDILLEECFERLGGYVKEFLERNGLTQKDIFGVGLSIAGIVDYKNGNMIYNAYAPQWGCYVPLTPHLNRIFGDDVIVYVENAGKAVGRAILLDSEAVKQKRVLTIFTAWGVSACIIERGHVLNGRDSVIGEIGRMYLEQPYEKDEYIMLEEMLSIQYVRGLVEKNPPPADSYLAGWATEEISFGMCFDASNNGDNYACEIVGGLARKMALAVHNIKFCVNPDIVVFHGEYAHAGKYFDSVFQKELTRLDSRACGSAFETVYDKRSIYELDAIGLTTALTNFFFRMDSLYSGKMEDTRF